MPFWNTQNTFWASGAVTGTLGLGYAYPEFNGLDLNKPHLLKAAIGWIVNDLYRSNFFASNKMQGEAEPGSIKSAVAAEDANNSTSPPNHGVYDCISKRCRSLPGNGRSIQGPKGDKVPQIWMNNKLTLWRHWKKLMSYKLVCHIIFG